MVMSRTRRTLTLTAALVGLAAAPMLANPPLSDATPPPVELNSTSDLMNSRGLGGAVVTQGEDKAGDGSGMTYTVTSSQPSGQLGRMAVPTADGKWAVPTGFATGPRTAPDEAAVADELARARTFAEAGKDLTWDNKRPGPLLTRGVVHETTSKPYAVTCSQFIGMVLVGWDYQHTTYVADQNTRVGRWVDFRQDTVGSDLWQANNMASWFYANGDLWLNQGEQYRPGDVLFFSQQNPEGSNAKVKQGSTGAYFANIYHTALYLGDGKIAQARSVGEGVLIEDLSPSLKQDLTLVARPQWQPADGNATTPNSAPASPTPTRAASGRTQPGTTASPVGGGQTTTSARTGSATGTVPAASGQDRVSAPAPAPSGSVPAGRVTAPADDPTNGNQPSAGSAPGQGANVPASGRKLPRTGN